MTGKILLYSHDTYGIGNIRRTVELCRAFAERLGGVSILVITGSRQADFFEVPRNVDMVKLPEVHRVDRGRYRPGAVGFPARELWSLRAEICRAVVSSYAPDILLVDKAPLGVAGELRPALDQLCRERPQCARVLGLRDILDEPGWVRSAWQENGTADAMMRYYDAIWVFGAPRVFDLGAEYGLPDGVLRKLSYLGFTGRTGSVRPADEVRARWGLGRGPIVLVTAGGGEDGDHLLTAYTEILPELRKLHPDLANVLLPGPRADHLLFDRVRRACERDPLSRVVSFEPRVLDIMNAATCVVCRSGYNTTCEVLLLEKPAVMVPRTSPVLEQRVRACRLRDAGAIRVCFPEELTPPRLLSEVRVLLDGWRPRVRGKDRIPFTGLERASEEMARLLSARESGGERGGEGDSSGDGTRPLRSRFRDALLRRRVMGGSPARSGRGAGSRRSRGSE